MEQVRDDEMLDLKMRIERLEMRVAILERTVLEMSRDTHVQPRDDDAMTFETKRGSVRI